MDEAKKFSVTSRHGITFYVHRTGTGWHDEGYEFSPDPEGALEKLPEDLRLIESKEARVLFLVRRCEGNRGDDFLNAIRDW